MEASAKIKLGMSPRHRLLRNVAKYKVENPLPLSINEKTYTLDETFEPLWNNLNKQIYVIYEKIQYCCFG